MKIVINRSDAIGDTLLTSPMAHLIKKNIPEAKVVFIISPKSQGLFEHHPYIDEYWVLDSRRSKVANFLQLLRLFRKERVGAYFHVGGSALPTFVARFLWVRIRGGLKSKISTLLFLNKGIRQKRSMVEMHESDYNLNLLAPLGIKYHYRQRQELAPVVKIEAYEMEQVEDWDREVIFVHPGMVGHTLNWSARNYARLVKRIESKYPGRFLFVVSYTPADKKYIDAFRDESALEQQQVEHLIYFNGAEKGLRNYMANLSRAKLFVGPSTGTTHIANALKVSQVAIYSPIRVQSALRWGPFDRDPARTRVITPPAVCGEATQCAKESCPYYKCMAKIEVDDVLEEVQALLEESDR